MWLNNSSRIGGSAQLISNSLGKAYTAASLRYAVCRLVGKTLRGRIINPDGIDNWSFHRLRVTCVAKSYGIIVRDRHAFD